MIEVVTTSARLTCHATRPRAIAFRWSIDHLRACGRRRHANVVMQKLRCYDRRMRSNALSCEQLSDADLLVEVGRRAASERLSTAALIAALMEVDARTLYLGEGCSSLFTYCTHVLHLSEHAAYGRIEAARAARHYPALLEHLADGSITLTTVGLLAPVLTAENHHAVLASARHQSKRAVEQLVATLRPQPDVPTVLRKLPTRSSARPMPPTSGSGSPSGSAPPDPPAAIVSTAPRPAQVAPLAPERYKVQLTVNRETYDTCGARRISCDTRSPTAIRPQSSRAR